MKHVQNRGMILLVVLLVMGLMAMILISSMRAFFLYKHMNQSFELRGNILAQMENTGMEQLNRWIISGEDSCVVSKLGHNVVMDYVLSKGCWAADNQIKLMYLIDDLGVIPCEQIIEGNKIFSVKHGLITVFTTSAPKLGLQIRIAFAIPLESEICAQPRVYKRMAGVISWRLIEDYDEH